MFVCGSGNKWESSPEWLPSMCVCWHTLKEQHGQGGFPVPGCSSARALSSTQSSSAPEVAFLLPRGLLKDEYLFLIWPYQRKKYGEEKLRQMCDTIAS